MNKLELQKHKYLTKSVKIYKVYGIGLLVAIFTSIIIKPFVKESYFILDFLNGFPILIIIMLAPIGLYYSWKSYKEKESNSITRLKYFLGHFIFCLLAFILILVILSDLKDAFK